MPDFKTGDTVEAVVTRGYALTKGKHYEVLKFEPSFADFNYTWPAYVHLVDDAGRNVIAHAHRFVKVESCAN